jgi:hypothetical protein
MDQLLAAMTLIGNLAGPFAATIAAIASIYTVLRGTKNTRKLDAANEGIQNVHLSINGRLGEMLELTAQKAHAEGVLAEKQRHLEAIVAPPAPPASPPPPAEHV